MNETTNVPVNLNNVIESNEVTCEEQGINQASEINRIMDAYGCSRGQETDVRSLSCMEVQLGGPVEGTYLDSTLAPKGTYKVIKSVVPADEHEVLHILAQLNGEESPNELWASFDKVSGDFVMNKFGFGVRSDDQLAVTYESTTQDCAGEANRVYRQVCANNLARTVWTSMVAPCAIFAEEREKQQWKVSELLGVPAEVMMELPRDLTTAELNFRGPVKDSK